MMLGWRSLPILYKSDPTKKENPNNMGKMQTSRLDVPRIERGTFCKAGVINTVRNRNHTTRPHARANSTCWKENPEAILYQPFLLERKGNASCRQPCA